MSEVISTEYNEDCDPAKTYERMAGADVEFYNKVRATKSEGTRTQVYDDLLEAHTGNSFFVKAGQVIRFEQRPSLHNGRTQIIDVQMVTPDLKQWADHLNNSGLEGLNLRQDSGVWSQSGYLEKMATLVEDEFPQDKLDEGFTHIFFAAHCNADWLQMLYGEEGNVNSCHENFIHAFLRVPAIAAIEDEEERKRVAMFHADRNDINIFQPNKFTQAEDNITRCVLAPAPPVEDGVGVEFYAEKDMYVVVSNCPYADQALPFPEAKPNPVYVSVYDTGVEPCHPGMNNQGWEDKVWERIHTKDVSPK
ncbi:DUF1989 domain-containing protein [Paraferrimonas sedimenticola]|uniref:DUF1989 domain-containing protein n=1 Tax=Paraferrimonas sedimenticola TaxID=375674 RepID=A0AA37RWL2_9GAMM|nr:DUF1989 domain-containing protein [Paraferrimonas sedimenticola]GLP96413.1 hypothetical protein GCM10007895_17190 [Paraferrimonas sedimenticola]